MSDRWVYDMGGAQRDALYPRVRPLRPFVCNVCGGAKWARREPWCCGVEGARHAQREMDIVNPDEAQDDTPGLVTR